MNRRKWLLLCMTMLGVVGTLCATAAFTSLFPWLHGRLNTEFPSLLLQVASLAIWIVCLLLLTGMAIASLSRQYSSRTRIFAWIVLTLTLLPIGFTGLISADPETMFLYGFGTWAEMDLGRTEFADLLPGSGTVIPETELDPWWPLSSETAGRDLWPLIPPDRWDDGLREASPSQIRQVDADCLLLVWRPSQPASWLRFVVTGSGNCQPPSALVNHMVVWKQIAGGQWVGLAIHR